MKYIKTFESYSMLPTDEINQSLYTLFDDYDLSSKPYQNDDDSDVSLIYEFESDTAYGVELTEELLKECVKVGKRLKYNKDMTSYIVVDTYNIYTQVKEQQSIIYINEDNIPLSKLQEMVSDVNVDVDDNIHLVSRIGFIIMWNKQKVIGRMLYESISSSEKTLEDYFNENRITLEHQRELEKLDCCHRGLTSLKGIENCINLIELSCRDNELTSLEGIENLTNLLHLNCSYNSLTSLDGIENCTNLVTLSCHTNQLESLKGIESCTNLTELYFTNNQLTSIECIERLIKLEDIDCGGNHLPFNNYNDMTAKEVRDSFYLIKHESEISDILCSITDDYDIDRYGFRYELEGGVTLTADLLKQLKIIYKKLKMLHITTYADIGRKSYSIADVNSLNNREFKLTTLLLKVDKLY